MTHADLLKNLLPPVSYSPVDPRLAAELKAEGNALDAVLANADRLLAAITPAGAGETITDWERVLGVTPRLGASQQERVAAVVAKIGETGGLSIPYFKQLAARLGYTIDIVEPQYAQAGVSRAGDAMWVTDIIWVWQVVVSGSAVVAYQARAGTAAAGDPITSFGDPVLETVFNDLKPAFTYVYFEYIGS
ncbi:YmfQ family protein [Burkholderia pyrrocinia]|uniref:YmfQ family protein n=1 Tax=Burkholderia pyrrocinia TaxID=60550 RepID=UPI00158D14DC|nr:putative phage tail protein [Burkholderia pyrrocinia]